jgi:3-isopropylmalate/(R)-2-methylmalate dehydratase small subunit
MNEMNWKLSGVCHKFGDDVRHDNGLMPFKYVSDRVYDPEVLKEHLCEDERPDLRSRVKPGDIIVAGKNFGKGKPHVQGYIAMRHLGMGVLCESMPFLTYRAAVGCGLLFLSDCAGVTGLVSDGDRIEVDFLSGNFVNHTTDVNRQFAPLPDGLRDMVALGGTTGVLRKWWEEQKAAEAALAG